MKIRIRKVEPIKSTSMANNLEGGGGGRSDRRIKRDIVPVLWG